MANIFPSSANMLPHDKKFMMGNEESDNPDESLLVESAHQLGMRMFGGTIARGYSLYKGATDIFKPIPNVVHNFHFMGVLHKVLKRENYLLISNDADTMMKATDFGLTAFIKEAVLDFHIDPWPFISNANDLVGKMLPRDMKQRITSAMVIEHP
ncbi:hypothetical protein RND71_003657 [Anisodus tanguticus]|uniref:Uncharacterized protein n=1 Tax=Anisodus tanguticus TaxID=243964 RepID=A0AAE1SZ08_9SOLA|nr:hypothetical protein RND71_003657 [Anisodus tanguticus]